MFERFTNEARQVLVRAQAEAARQGAGYLGTEHLLLGLLDSPAAALITALGGNTEALREAAVDATEPAETLITGRPPFTAQAKRVLELSLSEALRLGDNQINPKHLLLGLLHEGEGPAAQALVGVGVTLGGVRAFADVTESLIARRGRTRVRDLWDFRGPASSVVSTPGAGRIPLLASQIGGKSVTTIDYLRALLEERDGLAAKVLAELDVTPQKVAEKAAELGVAGTSDEGPEDRRSRQVHIRFGAGPEITIEDEDVSRQLHELASEGEDAIRDALRKLTEE